MDGDVAGIRIIPPIVEFVDIAANQAYSTTLSVQNVSKFSKKIRFHAPGSRKFKLSVKNPEKPVAPGLDIIATIEYEGDAAEDARDRIILSVDDDVIEIPLYAYTPTPLLDIEGPVDFGMVVAHSRVISQEVALINHGSVTGTFNITYDGKEPIVIFPTSGEVHPKTIQLIKVDLVTDKPGTINETATVKLEGMKDTKLEIKGCIVDQCLQFLASDQESPLSCVAFGPAFYGTDRIEEGFLFNSGPEPVKWVSILEEGADGEEAGTDLTKSTAAMLATSPVERIRGRAYDVLTSLVSTFPNQGQIGPYQKIPITFRFSPRFNSCNIGWEASEKPPPRQDFALFMTFEMVGSNDSFMSDAVIPNKRIEVAVTATAIPVLINIQPSNTFDFGEVMCGDHSSTLCTLSNESSLLPINIHCRKVAHFNVVPKNAKIAPGRSQDLLISFQPNQAGTFRLLQVLDLIGKVCGVSDSDEDVTKLYSKSFQTVPIQLNGVSVALTKSRVLKLNPGITPLLNNEIGPCGDVQFDEISQVVRQVRPSTINSAKTKLHQSDKIQDKALVAFPNDRSQSIRPSKRGEAHQTPYTGIHRHTYIDPDYTYTPEEEEAIKAHKDKYKLYLQELGQKRREADINTEFKKINNEKDLAIKPANGLRPPKLTAAEIENSVSNQPVLHEKHRLLTTRQLVNQEQKATTRPISQGLNAVPTTPVEKSDCKRRLSPQDLHKVIIGPPTIDFGEICLRSTNYKQLHIVNNLNHYIHVQVLINCKELRQTSPLSQVIPALSKAQFTLVFESNAEGKFQRSISYSVNSQHESHVLVLANIVPVALELSDSNLELSPEPGLPADAGYRSTVTLINRRNYPADFTWSPILSDRGTAFSIRPATGTVEAYKDLQCEVVFHPSYFAPLEGEFYMQVQNGNSMKLKCRATLGPANVKFIERRIQFAKVPLNMRTTKTALLRNPGPNHAMFYVINSTPFPGMTVSPTHGIVPVGGNAEFKVSLLPTAVVKFDTWIQVNIRGWKTIELRMGGTVEPPEVDIDVKAFKFNGVYCESTVSIPFNLINLSTTRVCAEVDLSKHTDFTLSIPEETIDKESSTNLEEMSPNKHLIELSGEQSLPCQLIFTPTSVASYDFTLPVLINKTGAPSPAPSTFPPTPVPSERHIITPRPILMSIPTPRRRVVATALRPTLVLSSHVLNFSLPVTYMEMKLSDDIGGNQQPLVLSNNSDKPLHWEICASASKSFIEDCTFAFLKPGGAWFPLEKISGDLNPGDSYKISIVFSPKRVGKYHYKLPIYLNDDKTTPYRHLTLKAFLQAPNILFNPLALVLTPVPLSTTVYAEFNMTASGYIREQKLKVNVPDAEGDDGSKISCFSLEFPQGSTISAASFTGIDENVSVTLPCILTFSSEKPVSATVDISITDETGRRFCIPVTATADNCLLTVYPFIAAHRNDHQIVCEQDKSLRGPTQEANSASLGEAVLLPCTSPTRSSTRGSTSVTSSHFGTTSSSFDESTGSVSESEFLPNSRDGAQQAAPDSLNTPSSKQRNRQKQSSSKEMAQDVAPIQKLVRMNQKNTDDSTTQRDLVSRSLGSAVFPFESSVEAHFHHEVLMAAQRWFSANGWPGGPFPIIVPETIRTLVSRNMNDNDVGSAVRKQNVNEARRPSLLGDSSLRKDVKTIYDMLQHLCGRVVPGIPVNQALPADPKERVLQLHWMHSTLLTFLRGQGASVSAIRPEFLMTPQDYRCWVKVRERAAAKRESKQEGKTCGNGPMEADGTKRVVEEKEPTLSTIHIEDELFESVSKRAWTDLLLQLFKVLVLARVTPNQYSSMRSLSKTSPLPKVNPDPLVSNVYSVGERIILAWLNHHYGQQRHTVWGDRDTIPLEKSKGALPPSRWVVNFDYDLLDGLVLASALAAYCPWLIAEFFSQMYTSPASPEQCLHNTLILVKAMRNAGIDYDIQATDITDPNPISLLLLCVHLYQNLPQYSAKTKVHFVGSLHASVRRQLRLTNSSSKPLKYFATISGRDAADFHLPKGDEIYLPPKSVASLEVAFTSRLIRPAEAVLVLVGRRECGKVTTTIGSTLVFVLDTAIDDIHPSGISRGEAPCYELQTIGVPVTNPFKKSAMFRIVLVESSDGPPSPFDIGSKSGYRKNSRKTLSTRIKSIKSRTDHGQTKEPSPPPSPPSEERMVPEKGSHHTPKQNMTSQLTSLFCHQSEIFLESQQTTTLQLEFLPFNIGKKHCSVLFVNEDVGEFLYAVEAVATLPLPSAVPHNSESQHSVRVSSAAAPIKSGKTARSDPDNVVYWKCENNSVLQENLQIPVTNDSKERALRVAARQRMSKREEERRILTGTLNSGSVTAAIAAMGMMNVYDQNDREGKFVSASAPPPPRSHKFTVECSSQWFQVPDSIIIPSPMTFGPPPASEMKALHARPNDRQDDGSVPLPIKFEPQGPGHYPCDLILRSPGDIRLYRIDCTVNPAGTTAKLDFRTPAHQSITQNIPIQNSSNHDWDLECVIDADEFYGPSHMTARAGQTTYYPLMFKPHFECTVTGNLIIKNKSGSQHLFNLCGVGESPLALEHIEIPCKCRDVTKWSVKVPNYAPHKLAYKVLTDIGCLEGNDILPVLKHDTAEYHFTVSPWKRGTSSGVLAFIIDDMEKSKLLYREDSDSDKEDNENDLGRPSAEGLSPDQKTPAYLKPKSDLGLSGYRVWFSIDIQAEPAAPIGVINVECPVQKLKEIEIPVKNPCGERVEFNVTIKGDLLKGSCKLVLTPYTPATYRIFFEPSVIGQSEGEVVFCSSHTGEFWYKLNLNCVSPPPTTLPSMECQLGRWSRQYINVSNPTEEPMEVEALISNEANFSLDVPVSPVSSASDISHTFIVQPKYNLDLPVQFMPTSLGLSTHQTTITLKSKHIGEAVYLISGRGLAPHPMEPVSVSAAVGSSTSLILPFRNPTDIPVFVDVMMSDHEQTLNSVSTSVIRNHVTLESAFCLLLKHSSSIALEPRQTLDIPFTFSPDKMRRYEGALAIALRREDGLPWPEETEGLEDLSGLKGASSEDSNVLRSLQRNDDGSIAAVRWIFPVHGIPEVRSHESKEAVLQCQARSRIEERLEVTLTGAMPSSSAAYEVAKLRAVTPVGSSGNVDGVVVEGHTVAEEFSYAIEYPDDGDARQHLEQALAVNLVRKQRDPHTGLVILVFNLVFSPFRQFNHVITLTVTSATGGVWSFPVSIRASEPPPDDVISVEAAGLGKGSTVNFTMFSHSKHPTPFNTFFVPGSDQGFTVFPESGDLQPQGTSGTRLSVTFTPVMYGRSYKARLIVQTSDMQWAYDVKGITPEYRVPNVPSAIFASTLSRPRAVAQRPRVNYIRKNMKLRATAVSSPIKGMTLFNHIKTQ